MPVEAKVRVKKQKGRKWKAPELMTRRIRGVLALEKLEG
jgi:hypothetical protein